MECGRALLSQNAVRAAPTAPGDCQIPNISPYKDGAEPRSDANSFPLSYPEDLSGILVSKTDIS